MPRVHQQVARKDYPREGIKAGETYYSWTFKNQRGPGTKVRSKTRPRPSQLTRSEYLSAAYALQERIEDLTADSDLPGNVEEIVSDLRSLAEEQEEKRNNMPEGLQDGDTGQLLETRAQNTNDFADELEGLDLEEFEEDESQRDKQECSDCNGTGHELNADGEETGNDCPTCDGTGEVDDEGSTPKNSDGETEEEYWQAKLEEVQNCSFNIE